MFKTVSVSIDKLQKSAHGVMGLSSSLLDIVILFRLFKMISDIQLLLETNKDPDTIVSLLVPKITLSDLNGIKISVADIKELSSWLIEI